MGMCIANPFYGNVYLRDPTWIMPCYWMECNYKSVDWYGEKHQEPDPKKIIPLILALKKPSRYSIELLYVGSYLFQSVQLDTLVRKNIWKWRGLIDLWNKKRNG
jgi:hypothetical protein